MGVITLPWSMEQDRENQIKANSVHVDDNFNTLLNATNGKLEADGSIVPTADLPMGSHKITGLATPTLNGDAATKGYVDSRDSALDATYVKLSGAQIVAGVKTFSSSPIVPTPTTNMQASTKKYVDDGLANYVKTSGNQTIDGTKTFSSTISGNIAGNAATVTNGVYTTGNQTINDVKTFTSSPVVPAPTNNTDASTKKYVDDGLATCVKTTGDETIAGTKTFSSTISGNISGSSSSCTGNAATATKATQDANGNNIVSTYAPKASPAFTGNPTAPTQSNTNNSTRIATTAFVRNVLEAIYPVGSVYIGTGTSCPIETFFGTWTRIDAGLALWTGNGTTGNGSTVTTTSTGATNKISAGAPNITGSWVPGIRTAEAQEVSGAFSEKTGSNITSWASSSSGITHGFTFDASASNSIYGNSSTVQPPAYVVNVWRRTA